MKYFQFFVRFVLLASIFGTAGMTAIILSDKAVLLPPIIDQTISFPISDNTPIPDISAKHIFILDRESQMVLFQKDADMTIYPASTTKMMTAIVAYKHFPLDSMITVSKSYPEGVDIGLKPGETLQFSNMLYALLIQSANDAAEVLAENYPGGRGAFVEAMNQEVALLGLRHTHFLNPTGLDQDGHYSSAADLARIANHLLGFPYLAKVVSTENAVISSPDRSTFRPLTNVNRLLGRTSGVVGIKTGFTDLAGESVVTLVNRDGHEVLISLFGSASRFEDTNKLITWVFDSFTWSPHP